MPLRGPSFKGLQSALQGTKKSHPIGAFKIGEKSHSTKVQEVFGKVKAKGG